MTFLAVIIDDVPNISIITKIELLSFNASYEETSVIKDFVSNSNIYDLKDEIIEETIKPRKQVKKIPDAIIAATALVNNHILITRNTSDFKSIKKLKVIDPFNTK